MNIKMETQMESPRVRLLFKCFRKEIPITPSGPRAEWGTRLQLPDGGFQLSWMTV